ncbi:hypothetical protein B566_EDAN014626 [Ephemera danica]|nr:hypothetical protein B566_EDAN014626 [Ephemera danica]
MGLEDVTSVVGLAKLLEERKDTMCQFLQEERLLHTTARCPRCDAGMRLAMARGSNSKFGHLWRCKRKRCGGARSATFDSFFFKTVMSVQTILTCMFQWCVGSSPQEAKNTLGISIKSVYQVYEYIRDVCSWHLLQTPHNFRLGGPGKIIEIDESKFAPRKYNKGRIRRGDTEWVLGMYCRSEKRGVLQLVSKRDASTLIPLIKEHVVPGSTIHTDLWGAYNTLSQHGYQHLTVNHSQNFVDPVTGTHKFQYS